MHDKSQYIQAEVEDVEENKSSNNVKLKCENQFVTIFQVFISILIEERSRKRYEYYCSWFNYNS
jgi:hypothetical protein